MSSIFTGVQQFNNVSRKCLIEAPSEPYILWFEWLFVMTNQQQSQQVSGVFWSDLTTRGPCLL